MYGKIKFVIKRDNACEDFDISRLQLSINKIIKSTNEYDEDDSSIDSVSRRLSFTVVNVLSNYIDEDGGINIDQIYDSVADCLFDIGYHHTGKSYLKTRYENIISEKDKEISTLKNKFREYIGECNNESN